MKANETKNRRINPEYTGQIIDVFEDYLEEKNVYIPNAERNADGIDDDIRIYGGDYDDIASSISEVVTAWNGEPDVFVPGIEIPYAEEGSEIAKLLAPGECVARICIEGEYVPREIIMPIDSDDVSGGLEETLHRLLENGLDPCIMGARKREDDDDEERWTDIDLGYGIAGSILSLVYTRTERMWLRDFPDYIGRHYNLNHDAMIFLNTFVKKWLVWQDDPYESIMNELKMFMSGFDIDPRIYGMVEEFRNLEE